MIILCVSEIELRIFGWGYVCEDRIIDGIFFLYGFRNYLIYVNFL